MSSEARRDQPPIMTRRGWVKYVAVVGGASALGVSVVDWTASALKIADQVDRDHPQILNIKAKDSLNQYRTRLKNTEKRTSVQEQDLTSTETLIVSDQANDSLRNAESAQLRTESDQYKILGLVERGSLRFKAAVVGGLAVGASLLSEVGPSIYRHFKKH